MLFVSEGRETLFAAFAGKALCVSVATNKSLLQMKPSFYQKISPLLLASLGVLGLVAFFFVLADSPLLRLLHFEKSREAILAQAQQAFEASPLAQASLPRDYEVTVSKSLLKYAQQHALSDSARAQLSYARWEVRWSGANKEDEDTEKKSHFALEYDLAGRLVGFSQAYPGLKDSVKVPEAEAMRRAKEFLLAQGLDTATVRLTQKKITEEDQVSKYNFRFERALALGAELTEVFTLDLAGSGVTNYERKVEHTKPNEAERFDAEQITEIAAYISAVVVWFVFSLVLIVTFFRRLRHDELEFKRARWWGLLGFVVVATAIAFQAWPEWKGILIGGGLGGFFVGLGLVFVYATTDSFCRDISPEKMLLSDLVQRGQLRVREIGAALFRALFIASVALLLWSLILRLVAATGIGYYEIDHEQLWYLRDKRYWIGTPLSLLVGVCFIGLIFVNFWQAYLQSKIKRGAILFLTYMLSLHLAGFYTQFINPTWLGALLCLPLSALWTYFVLREDYLTSFCATVIFHLFAALVLTPWSWNGPLPWYALGILLWLALAFFFYKSPHGAEDFEDYVPEYVSRIAARERFLKELEIARNVQMRFLPARVPEFPGLELASICRPAMEVGGDYFDFVPHGKEALSVFVGDVSGKGVSAAFFMTMAKGIIKTLVKRLASPKQLLTEMNEVFYENSPKEIFISLIYGYFDMQKKTLTFARAGHNPLIVRKSKGAEPELLHPKGLAIGMDSGAHFARTIEEITVPLTPGDTFVFYTDGISESMNTEGEEFGEEKLCALVNAGSNESATVLLERITAEVNLFADGAQQHDDFTMVVVKVSGNWE